MMTAIKPGLNIVKRQYLQSSTVYYISKSLGKSP